MGFLTRLIAFACVLPFIPGCAPSVSSPVVIKLSKVTVENSGGRMRFICETEIHNETGAELMVKSNYYSAFDGLMIVVLDKGGKILKKQLYTDYYSLFSDEPRSFPLRRGKNTERLIFPINGLPPDTTDFCVYITGNLPGSEYPGILQSDTVTVVVK